MKSGFTELKDVDIYIDTEKQHCMTAGAKPVYILITTNGCDIEHFKQHIENQWEEGMTWENYGEWHIDHYVPLKYDNPTLEEVIDRLHWENTQPMWASENIKKGNRDIY